MSINMLMTNQEMLIDMIDHIEDKEEKAKFIRKIMEKCKTRVNLSFSKKNGANMVNFPL